MSSPQAGDCVANYELVRLLGRGAAGAVFEGLHRETGARRAVKLTLSSLDLEELARCEREGEALARVVHPALLRVHAAGVEAGRFFLVTELAAGGSLQDRISRETLSPDQAREFFAEIAQGLALVHQAGITHRDIKPANILLTAEGRPKLADFGLARLNDRSRLTETGTLVGTPIYMAPEQAAGGGVGPAADVYSLAATLYCALAGRPPIEAGAGIWETLRRISEESPTPLEALLPGIEPSLAAVVAAALDKDPERRPSAAEFAALLDSPEAGSQFPAGRVALVSLAVLSLVAALLFGIAGATPRPPDQAKSSASVATRASETSSSPQAEAELGHYARLLADLEARRELDSSTLDLERAPHGAQEQVARGRVYELLGRPRLALLDYDAALEAGPSPLARLGRARVQRGLGDFKSALADLDLLLAQEGLEPSTERAARLVRIRVFFSLKRAPDALREADYLLEQDPNDVEALARRAHAKQVLGNLEEAGRDLEAALEIDPRHVNALCERAMLLKKRGFHRRAAKAYEQVLRIDPRNRLALGNLGALCLGLGELARAEQLLRRVVAVNPRDEVALANLSLLALRRGEFRRAEELAGRVIEIRPDRGEHYQLLASVHLERGDLEGAIRVLERGVAADPDFARGKEFLAELRRRQAAGQGR